MSLSSRIILNSPLCVSLLKISAQFSKFSLNRILISSFWVIFRVLGLRVDFFFYSENVGAEKSNELEKSLEVVSSVFRAWFALLLHAPSRSQAWSCRLSFMVVSCFFFSNFPSFFSSFGGLTSVLVFAQLGKCVNQLIRFSELTLIMQNFL